MISTTVGTEVNGTQFIGGIAGLAAAVVIGYLVYRGGSRLDLRLFFRLTGFLIILFAAGLIAKGIHEFQEAGVLVVLNEHVWQLGVLDPDTTTIGRFAKTMFGWSPAPSLLMVIGYLAFLVPVTVTFARMTAKVDARRSPKPQPIGP
jgi:high-affinity iron transporter